MEEVPRDPSATHGLSFADPVWESKSPKGPNDSSAQESQDKFRIFFPLFTAGGRWFPPDCSPAPDFSLKKCSQTTYPSASLDSTPGPSPPSHAGGAWESLKLAESLGGERQAPEPGGRPAIGVGGLANCSSGMLCLHSALTACENLQISSWDTPAP